MKLIHTMPDIDKEASGPSYSVTRLCESLIAHEAQVQLALVGDATLMRDRPYVRAFPAGFGPARLGNSPAMNRWLKQQVADGSVDLVHNHSLWMLPNVYPGWATQGSRIPYVVSPRGTLSEWAMASGSKIKRLYWPLLQKPSIAHAALFHATAESEYHDIRRMGFKQPVAVIPNGIDLPEYQAKPARNQRTLLFFGRLHPVKGVDHLLQAWALLQDEFPQWQLRITGPGDADYVHYLKTLAQDLRVQRASFDGPIYGTGKFNAYRQADLYVLPSHSENFGMTVAEALACGTPCVVSQGAPWKGLEANQAGWWPKIGTEPLMAALRVALAKPQTELDTMGENGRQWMDHAFSWSHIGDTMTQVYAWLLQQAERPDCVVLD
jgi:glycosyltransferase involved in cell wall biosynthesis